MLLSVVEGSNNSSQLRRALVTRQLMEIRILLMPQNEMVSLARPREMCVSFTAPYLRTSSNIEH
jgi:hypothetical protein